jgi:hypothetical protein
MAKFRNVNGILSHNMVNISIDGKLHKKVCKTVEDARYLFDLVLKAKENPTDENVNNVLLYMNDKTRVAVAVGLDILEANTITGEVYFAGFNTPVPQVLIDIIIDYHENGYNMDAVVNFWKLLMINPDVRVRKSLFDFITKHDFVLTDAGYMIVYKYVHYKTEKNVKSADLSFKEFVSNQFLYVKSKWRCSPNKYVAYKNAEGNYAITKVETAEGWTDHNVEILGKLGDLYKALFETKAEEPTEVLYTDKYSHTMTIKLGAVTWMERKKCDSDPAIDCSYGLHVGATKYVESYADSKSVVLACYVNPANVVAVPTYDTSKMRVTEYFPFAIANYENKKIEIIEQKYFESDYCNYEKAELEKQIALVKANELPIPTAIKAKDDERPMSELMKILETRLIDLDDLE